MGSSGPTGATGPSGPQGPSGAAGSLPITNSDGTTAAGAHVVYGTATLSGGPPASVMVTLSDTAKFTTTSSYVCTANDTESVEPIQVQNQDNARFTLTGAGDLDVVSYICVGN